jgi:hypothetical protein
MIVYFIDSFALFHFGCIGTSVAVCEISWECLPPVFVLSPTTTATAVTTEMQALKSFPERWTCRSSL